MVASGDACLKVGCEIGHGQSGAQIVKADVLCVGDFRYAADGKRIQVRRKSNREKLIKYGSYVLPS